MRVMGDFEELSELLLAHALPHVGVSDDDATSFPEVLVPAGVVAVKVRV